MRNYTMSDFDGREGLSLVDACHVAGLGKTTILDLVNSGTLPVRRFGRRILILRSDLLAWLAALPQMKPQSI